MALGAQQSAVVALVVGDALRVVALGVAVGIPVALGSARLLRSQLHGVSPTDPVSIAIGVSVLAVSALLAALVRPVVRRLSRRSWRCARTEREHRTAQAASKARDTR